MLESELPVRSASRRDHRKTHSQMLKKIRTLLDLPASQRKAKIQSGLRDRTSSCLYRYLGSWLNGSKTRFQLDFRPDSHYNFNNVGDYEALLKGWLAGNRENNGGDLSRFYTLFLNVNQILREGIPGDFVELGVYKGNSACILAALARSQN